MTNRLPIAHHATHDSRLRFTKRWNEAYLVGSPRSTEANGPCMQVSGQRRLKKATRRICHSVHTPRRCTDTDTHRASLADTGSPDRFHVARERVRLFLRYRRLVTVCAPALRDAGSSLAYLTPWMRSRTRVRSARTGDSARTHTALHRRRSLLLAGLCAHGHVARLARNLPVIDCARAIIRWTTDRQPVFSIRVSPRLALWIFDTDGWERVPMCFTMFGLLSGIVSFDENRAARSSTL